MSSDAADRMLSNYCHGDEIAVSLMRRSLHTGLFRDGNLRDVMKSACAAGFEGVELQAEMVDGFLVAGGSIAEANICRGAMSVCMVDLLLGIERNDQPYQTQIDARCEELARLAAELGCPFLQVVALDRFEGSTRHGRRRQLRARLGTLADIASAFGVRLALEPVCFSRFHALDEALDLLGDIGTSRMSLVLDTWHLWASETDWDDVASLDPRWIACAHVGDALPKDGPLWRDEDRSVLPGEGIVPVVEATRAIMATGFEGPYAVEMVRDQSRETDSLSLTKALFTALSRCLDSATDDAATRTPRA